MSLEEKQKVVEGLYYIDRSGVVWRLSRSGRERAQQLLQEHPTLSVRELLLRVPLEEPLPIPSF